MVVSQLCFAEHAPSELEKHDIEMLDAFQNLQVRKENFYYEVHN
jgi:hypothetical protein